MTHKNSLTKLEVLKRFKAIHADKYCYSKFVYTGALDKSIIICKIHGEFQMSYANHTNKTKARGCRKCGSLSVSKKLRFSNKQYDQQLIDNGIAIKRLATYLGKDTAILHLCECGNVWSVRPGHVLRENSHCGCRVVPIHLASYYKGKKTILYIVKIGTKYKVGITVFSKNIPYSIKKRFASTKYGKVVLLQHKVFESGNIAYKIEQKILKKFKKFITKDKLPYKGASEVFDINISNYVTLNKRIKNDWVTITHKKRRIPSKW